MYLTEPKMNEIVLKQYKYKINSYIGALISLMMCQIIAMAFSFGGSGMLGTSSDFFDIMVHYYTADFVFIFTMLWAFITAITITTKTYRYDDFSFVTNRLTSNFSNVLFLVTISLTGAVTAVLSSFFLKVLMYFYFDMEQMMIVQTTFLEYFTGFIGLFFYLLLFSSIGYFFGTVSQISKVFVFLIPVLLFGSLILGVSVPIIAEVFQFYANEASILLFVLKVFVTVVMIFSGAIAISNQLEVK